MLLVYIPGVWDLLHVGHLQALKAARALGDRLIVGVADDLVVQQDKQRLPIIRAADRCQMVGALRCVNVAMLYRQLSFLPHLNMLRPDVLAVSEGWGSEQRHRDAEDWVRSHSCRLVKLPYYQDESTTQITSRVRLQRGD